MSRDETSLLLPQIPFLLASLLAAAVLRFIRLGEKADASKRLALAPPERRASNVGYVSGGAIRVQIATGCRNGRSPEGESKPRL
jgi:hypothetical protein